MEHLVKLTFNDGCKLQLDSLVHSANSESAKISSLSLRHPADALDLCYLNFCHCYFLLIR